MSTNNGFGTADLRQNAFEFDNASSSEAGPSGIGSSSNPLSHPFSNNLYPYRQHAQAFQRQILQSWEQVAAADGDDENDTLEGDLEGSGWIVQPDEVIGDGNDVEIPLPAVQPQAGSLPTSTSRYTSGASLPIPGEINPSYALSSRATSPGLESTTMPQPPFTSQAASGSASVSKEEANSLAQPPPHPRTLDELLVQFWTRQMEQAESGVSEHADGADEPDSEEFKNFALPLARIKKVMKSDPDVKMISAEVPVLLSKACEIFIAELTCRAWLVAESFKRRTLQKSDVASAIGYSDMFDFLIDIVPREEALSKAEIGHRKRNAKYKEKRQEEKQARKARLDDESGDTDGDELVPTSAGNPQQDGLSRPNQGNESGAGG